MEKTLYESNENQLLIISRVIEVSPSKLQRLAEYGFVCGQNVILIKKVGGVCLVGIRGYVLGLDNLTAKKVIVCD